MMQASTTSRWKYSIVFYSRFFTLLQLWYMQIPNITTATAIINSTILWNKTVVMPAQHPRNPATIKKMYPRKPINPNKRAKLASTTFISLVLFS